MAVVKHIYQRTITSKGKKIKAWYYWYKDNSGKVIRKSCGQNKKPCLIKREAQEFVANLNDDDLLNNGKPSDKITLRSFTKGIFDDNSKTLVKLANRGTVFSKQTIKQKRLMLNCYILPKFGNCTPDQVTSNKVENWLMEYDCSNSYKNQIINVLELIYQELYDNEIIDNIPVFQKFKISTASSTGIFTREEIDWLFPVDDYKKLTDIWRLTKEDDFKAFMYATLYYTTLTMGLRSGEVRAIQMDQINGNYLIINKMIDSDGKVVDHLKKGNDVNKKWRVVPIPAKTKKLLNEYIKQRAGHATTNFLFELYGTFIGTSTLSRHFQLCLQKNGVDYRKRKLHVHSLRFTCNSMLRHHIPEDILRSMIGHTSQSMTDYYDKSDIEMKEDVLSSQLNNINDIW